MPGYTLSTLKAEDSELMTMLRIEELYAGTSARDDLNEELDTAGLDGGDGG